MSNETKQAFINYLNSPDDISKETATKYLKKRGYAVNKLKIKLLKELEQTVKNLLKADKLQIKKDRDEQA
jgi:hypothetical protein